mgnify:FL=1
MTINEIKLDLDRNKRIGLDEAIFCEGKSTDQIVEAINSLGNQRMLLTRLNKEVFLNLPSAVKTLIDYNDISRTGIFGDTKNESEKKSVAIVTAGTSDIKVSRETIRTLKYYGIGCLEINDVGVAGIWRIMERIDEIRNLSVTIVVAGMDGALVSVIGGLVGGIVVGVPTSTGYGASEKGKTALKAMLSSCSPGIAIVNIDNGYGAACVALRSLRTAELINNKSKL